jgi:hypothetical protein
VFDGPLLSEALEQLRADGFRIGADKLQRLSVFGIHSTRRGRRHYLDARSFADLRYVLEIERRGLFARDHDGLCLELGYRAYRTVPWDRVHRGARDRASTVFARIDRELHRANNWPGSGFPPRRIPHLAHQLARHFVPDRKIAADPAYKLARDITEHCACMLLRVAYNNESFTERDLIRLLLMLRAEEKPATEFAPKAMIFLHAIEPWIREKRSQFSIAVGGHATESDIQAAIDVLRFFSRLFSRLADGGVQVPFHAVPDYPKLETEPMSAVDIGLRSLSYAAAFDVSRSESGPENIARYANGDTEAIDKAIDDFITLFALIPKVIGVDNAK